MLLHWQAFQEEREEKLSVMRSVFSLLPAPRVPAPWCWVCSDSGGESLWSTAVHSPPPAVVTYHTTLAEPSCPQGGGGRYVCGQCSQLTCRLLPLSPGRKEKVCACVLLHCSSLVPRPHPAFCCLQYGNFYLVRGESLGTRLTLERCPGLPSKAW